MSKIITRISNLLSIKSIITLVLTVVFAYMTITQTVNSEFLSIYTMIIGFYFGTQATKTNNQGGDN